jgi:hypothetical protein
MLLEIVAARFYPRLDVEGATKVSDIRSRKTQLVAKEEDDGNEKYLSLWPESDGKGGHMTNCDFLFIW